MTQFCIEEAVLERADFLERMAKTRAAAGEESSESADPLAQPELELARQFALGQVN